MERGHFLNHWVQLLLVAVFALTLAACAGGGDQKQASTEPPPFDIRVFQVAQYSKLGNQVPDGQYVVVGFKIKNNTNETQLLSPGDFEIRNITTNPDEQYAQVNETRLLSPFSKEYGSDKMGQLMETVETTIHPRMDVERYMIYMLPNDVTLENYEIYYKTYDVKIPLVGSDTEVKDTREQSYDSY